MVISAVCPFGTTVVPMKLTMQFVALMLKVSFSIMIDSRVTVPSPMFWTYMIVLDSSNLTFWMNIALPALLISVIQTKTIPIVIRTKVANKTIIMIGFIPFLALRKFLQTFTYYPFPMFLQTLLEKCMCRSIMKQCYLFFRI